MARSEECCLAIGSPESFESRRGKADSPNRCTTSSRRAPYAAGRRKRRRHDVGLNFVVLRLLRRGGMVDWVDEVPKFHGAVAATLQGRRQRNPSGSVGILTAVLADARHVSFDVARLKDAFVERRVEQLDQFVPATHQTLLNGVHRRSSSRRVC